MLLHYTTIYRFCQLFEHGTDFCIKAARMYKITFSRLTKNLFPNLILSFSVESYTHIGRIERKKRGNTANEKRTAKKFVVRFKSFL